MSIKTTFANFGHAIAHGAKHFVEYAGELAGILDKIAQSEVVVEKVEQLAAPQLVAPTDLAFHVLGDVSQVLKGVNVAGKDLAANHTINVTTSVATILQIQHLTDLIESLLKVRGATVPAPTPTA